MEIQQDHNRYFISWFLTVAFTVIILILVFFDIKEGSKEIVYTLLGSLGTAFGMVINYYFGSSEGSKEKTKMLGG